MNKQTESAKTLTPVSQLGEFGLIEHLTKHIRLKHDSSIKGIGDDAAVLQYAQDEQTVLTTDLLMEGIHFDLMYTPLKHLGYKAVVVNLSDIYAMNAQPRQITVSLALSSRFTVEALDELYDGILTACRHYEVDLIGGDTSSSHKGLFISITALGVVEKEKVVYRSNAQVGDLVCVTGDLGAAYLGLQLLEREKQIFLENPEVQPDLEQEKHLVGRFLRPEARRDIIDILDKFDILPTAMIDISDGLSSELFHICHQSKVGCEIFEENVPIHQEAYNRAIKFNINPITCALNGGEDYELLFTISPKDRAKLDNIMGISIIGNIAEQNKGLQLFTRSGQAHELVAQGWQHH